VQRAEQKARDQHRKASNPSNQSDFFNKISQKCASKGSRYVLVTKHLLFQKFEGEQSSIRP
jgi:hypothetical protein